MNALLIQLLQAALNALTLPEGIQRAFVMTKMPISGWPAMPFVNVNLELIRQTEVAVGEDVSNPTADNIWTLFALAQRTWRVTVTTPSAEERDFYRDTLLSILRVIDAMVFSAIGLTVSHAVQAASYPLARQRDGQVPGFYCADILLQTEGNFSTSVRTDYPVIVAVSSETTVLPANFTIELNPSAT